MKAYIMDRLHVTVGRFLCAATLLLMSSCTPGSTSSSQLDPAIDTELAPLQSSILDARGNTQEVARSRDADGVQTDFVVGLVRLRRIGQADLQTFLDRYRGIVVSDDAIPEPPAALGITLTDEQRQATEYVVQIDLGRVDTSSFAANAAAQGIATGFAVSSDAGLRTFAAVADAVAGGLHASPDFMNYGNADHVPTTFPEVLTKTNDTDNAFNYSYFGPSGSRSNVTTAWQFVAAHGIQRRVKVAIIDGGFWLDHDGRPRNSQTDLPSLPEQHNFAEPANPFADGPNPAKCSEGSNCYWHGTTSADVATGIANNGAAYAGTGGFVADPMLLKTNSSQSQNHAAIRYAVAMGADVVSISSGHDCNAACQIYDRDDAPINDAVNAGSKTVFVASAGNGDSSGNGYDVGATHSFHPCIEDHIICVGALADGGIGRISYSNYGEGVDLFAPTDIWVEATPSQDEPNPDDPGRTAKVSQKEGTSASAPFVAGVAAMMKAINPNLSSDDVARILRVTAHPGAGEVTAYLNAYAAVHAAAEGLPGVRDNLENNDLDNTPTNLGAITTEFRDNLTIDSPSDIDYFRFESPAGFKMELDLTHPVELGAISLVNFHGVGGAGQPIPECDGDLPGAAHVFYYTLPGGTYEFGLRAADVTAYDMIISLTAPSALIQPDTYEPNNTVATARYIHSLKSTGAHFRPRSEPTVTIDASIHTAADVDYYIVRAAKLTLAQQVLLVAYPIVEVYGNEAHIAVDVWKLNSDNTPGALVESIAGGSCGNQVGTRQVLSIRLDDDQYYLVRVTGGIGRYTLHNGIDSSRRDIAVLAQNPLYVILNPGDPIEHRLRFPERYVFVADTAFASVRVVGPGVHLRLRDSASNAITEGVLNGLGESLSLASTTVNQIYAMDVAPKDPSAEPPVVDLAWDSTAPTRSTANLITNAGAEIIVGPDPGQDVPYWEIVQGTPRIFYYDNNSPTTNPSFVGPGPSDRGSHLLAGGPNNTLSQLRQTISIDPAWQQAINDGHVTFDFSAFLGGLLGEPDHTEASLTFLDANFQALGQQGIPSVTTLDRNAESGLFPVEAIDHLPIGTAFIQVDLVFRGAVGNYNDGYADNLDLILSEYSH